MGAVDREYAVTNSDDLTPLEGAGRQVFTRSDWDRGIEEGWLTREEVEDHSSVSPSTSSARITGDEEGTP